MDYVFDRLLIFIFTFVSVSVMVWAGFKLLQAGLKEYEKHYVEKTSSTLAEMFIFQDARKVFVLNLIVTVLFLLVGFVLFRNVVYVVLFGVIGFAIPRALIWRAKKRRLERFASQLVDGLIVLSNALRSGLNLIQAIETLEQEQEPPISQEFGLVIRENLIGVSIEEALENLAKRVPNEDLKLLVTSINIVRGMGGNLTEVFDSMANVIRERVRLEGRTKALTAQGRLQGIVVGFLPLVLGLIMYVMDPPSMERMFTSPIGNVALGLMFAMQVIGYVIIRRVTTIEV